ncbi:MAG: response regulator [Ahrensia sp.]
MSLASQISTHLPMLRRFSRALTGSQIGGDNYVAALLEAIVADQSAYSGAENPKITLFRSLVQMWSSLDVNLKSETAINMDQASDKNLQAIAPVPRQAFLLTEVEGFTRQETMQILGVSEADLQDLLNQAARNIADQVATSVLIIEDEPLIAMDIEDMVIDLGHRVTGIARTHSEAIALIGKEKPGIVLADIQLADGSSGIDAVNEILTQINVPVIFITAYPERLLTGDRPEPAYLVTKPFQPNTVSALISQALFFGDNAKEAA